MFEFNPDMVLADDEEGTDMDMSKLRNEDGDEEETEVGHFLSNDKTL